MIRTIYLLPHAHTDIGYSHDPIVALELHDRFLDRAIDLCERTRDYPDGAQFRWTVEAAFSFFHWWENRGPAEHQRLRECLRLGEIDIGARYLNGTELYDAGDIAWEAKELRRLTDLTGYHPVAAIQNDVNGFPLALAESLVQGGARSVVMGLNTTMGHSPFPRCHAFRWQVGDGQLLVWNGWIYNRIKGFCHLDRLGVDFQGRVDLFLASLPADYPFDFAMTSATIGDNVGPFPALADQVRAFNERSASVQLRLATFRQFTQALDSCQVELDVLTGNWPDFWTFGAGSMPQMVASLRRAQRRLRLVEAIRLEGWADVTGGSLDHQRARRACALACEHTYDSHTSSGLDSGSSDSLRQKAQIRIDAATAESCSMVLLRDHLTAMAEALPPEPVSVLAVNPHPWPVALDYFSEEKGLLNFASSRRPEHLFQFDREPTFEALAEAGTFGALELTVPAGGQLCAPLKSLPKSEWTEVSTTAEATLGCLTFDAGPAGLTRWAPSGRNLIHGLALEFIEEHPVGAFQLSGTADMDPSDCRWNPDLRLEQQPGTGKIQAMRQRQRGQQSTLSSLRSGSPLTELQFTLDPRFPARLSVTTSWQFGVESSQHAWYLTLPLDLPGEGQCEYWVDGCGVWFQAERDQLPGTCNSFYQAQSGIAVSRGGETVYIAAADTTLFQFGGYTFGQLPATPLQRTRPFVALWIYNNYWGTNFPSMSPGQFTARFLLEHHQASFNAETAAELDAAFDAPYLTHPVA